MVKIEGDVRAVIEQSEWVAVATVGPEGPHLAATWGDYVRALGVDDGRILIPAGGMHRTEANLETEPRIELLFATRRVPSSSGSGQGCRLRGTAAFEAAGPAADAVKARFSWARGALIVQVTEVSTQL